MANRLIPLLDNVLVRKRAVIESIHDQLKNISQIELGISKAQVAREFGISRKTLYQYIAQSVVR
jgi:DNA invertase Pin-like site-specific DNA recombinase